MGLELVMKNSLYSTIPPLMSHFGHHNFTLAQTIERLRTGEALKSLGFARKLIIHVQVSNDQFLQV